MESGFIMFIHSAIISLILYVIMRFIMKQPVLISQNRSILIGTLALIYMILFGHGLPRQINKNL